MSLVLIFFTSEMIPGMGFWMIWLAVLDHPQRSRQAKVIATIVIAPLLVFTHPAMAITSVVFAIGGFGLSLLGRPFPRHLAIASAAMGVLVAAGLLRHRGAVARDQSDARRRSCRAASTTTSIRLWMLATLGFFPVLAVFWLLLVAPGLDGTAARWRLSRTALGDPCRHRPVVRAERHQHPDLDLRPQHGAVALAVALCLALASPAATWLQAARRPLDDLRGDHGDRRSVLRHRSLPVRPRRPTPGWRR